MRRIALALVASLAACNTARPGMVRSSSDNPLVTIGAGDVPLGNGNPYDARYVIDQRTHLCWFTLDGVPASVDCCALAGMDEAKPYLPWAASSCAPPAPAAPEAPPAAPASPAAP